MLLPGNGQQSTLCDQNVRKQCQSLVIYFISSTIFPVVKHPCFKDITVVPSRIILYNARNGKNLSLYGGRSNCQFSDDRIDACCASKNLEVDKFGRHMYNSEILTIQMFQCYLYAMMSFGEVQLNVVKGKIVQNDLEFISCNPVATGSLLLKSKIRSQYF